MRTNILRCIGLMVCFLALHIGTANAQEPPKLGLHWFKSNTDFKKHSAGISSEYFDPNKKTMIFAHGWQNNAIANDFYESFDYKKHDDKYGFPDDLTTAWKDKDWNVGVFYWREFADDGILEAESKVWSNRGLHGMRMKTKNADGTVTVTEHRDVPYAFRSKSVSDLFYEAYKEAMYYHGPQEIRLVGHSLGQQLVVATAEKIVDKVRAGALPRNAQPDRIALLDPFYSNFLKPFWLLSTTGEKAADAVEKMRDRGIAFEMYRYSLVTGLGEIIGGVTSFNQNNLLRLRNASAQQEMRPWYINDVIRDEFAGLGNKHIAAPYLYFQTMAYKEAPDEVKLGDWVGPWYFRYWDPFKAKPTGYKALSAVTPTWRVKQMMNDDYYWDQVEGRFSPRTGDDLFVKKRR